MSEVKLKAPFPYPGGKSVVAAEIWDALGNVGHYMEPFYGSGAVHLARPDYNPGKHVETICDKDGFVCNVWRAMKFSPLETAEWCDWPVNHADLAARKKQLIKNEQHLLENLVADPEWHDAKLAGYWIWASSCWIGSGLTRTGSIPRLTGFRGAGVNTLWQIPRPQLSNDQGVVSIAKRPRLTGFSGTGVFAKGCQIEEHFLRLQARLRRVRVVCGDWTRICGGEWQDKFSGVCGIFFDPPYATITRDTRIYHHDSTTVAHDVREWALKRGESSNYRIVLAGYYDEHVSLLEHGWRVKRWCTGGGYSNIAKGESQGKKNKVLEALFFSPACLDNQPELF
ncbi:MAG: DNA adenine methylase [Lentisphaerota bacterium]